VISTTLRDCIILVCLVSNIVGCSGGFNSDSTETPAPTGVYETLVTMTSPVDEAHFNSTNLTVSGTCTTTAGAVTISGAGLQVDVVTPCTSGNFSAAVAFTQEDGNKTLTISQTVAAGSDSHHYTLVRDCPEHYNLIPANATLGTAAFCLATYEMKVATNAGAAVFDGYNGGVALDGTMYKPESRPDGIPWVRITQAEAIAECSSIHPGYHLVTAEEWASAARNVESVAGNWESGIVGTGKLASGNSDGTISASAIADGFAVTGSNLLSAGNASDPYAGTGNNSGEAWGSGKEQRRSFLLSNGESIWDLAGNAREFNDVDGLGSTVSYTGPGTGFFDVFSASITTFLSSITLSSGGVFNSLWMVPATAGLDHATNNVGQIYTLNAGQVGKIITRGANFSSSTNPGIFAADFDTNNSTTGSSAGFRCAKSL
jgi:hypothetical protein